MATLVALIMVGMLALIGIAALSTSDDEVMVAGNQLHETQAFYAAESGLDVAAASIQHQYETSGGKPPTSLPEGEDDINGCSVLYTTTPDGGATSEVLTTGTLSGLHALVQSYTLQSTGTSGDNSSEVELQQQFKAALVPIFQFAVFYGQDLEIAPGPEMNLLGRVHSNQDLYIQAGNRLRMDSYTTAAGNIYHGRKGPGSTDAGDVLVKNGVGDYVSMKEGSGWLDANDGHWYDSSVARWNGRVQDASHGQKAIELPLEGTTDAHQIIEPAGSTNTNSYEHKATLKFIDNQAFKKDNTGAWVNVTADMTAKGIITYSADKFYDGREAKNVDVTDLDMDKLYSEGYGPTNGIIYFSDNVVGSSEYPALRLKNGTELGDELTIASANPVYTVGNYNSTNKKPASIMTDALTFLSSAWDDAKGALAKSNRVANATTVNCSYLTGNKSTTSTVYSGGFENLPRFLESWTNKTMTWRGSAVCLWQAEQALGSWGGTYYDPPNRSWWYDMDLDDPANLPPGTPMAQVFQRLGWQQHHAIIDAQKF
jgi:hypothetical protein